MAQMISNQKENLIVWQGRVFQLIIIDRVTDSSMFLRGGWWVQLHSCPHPSPRLPVWLGFRSALWAAERHRQQGRCGHPQATVHTGIVPFPNPGKEVCPLSPLVNYLTPFFIVADDTDSCAGPLYTLSLAQPFPGVVMAICMPWNWSQGLCSLS